MPIFKAILLCNAGKYGFSETYYINATDRTTARDRATVILPPARQRFMGASVFVEAVKTVDFNVGRIGFLDSYSPPVRGDADSMDTPWQSVLCRFGTDSFYWSMRQFHGLGDIQVRNDAVNIERPQEALVQQLSDFVKAFQSIGGCIRVLARPGDGTTAYPITAMSLPVGLPLQFLAPGHNLAVGDVCSVRNVRGPYCRNPREFAQVNGRWTVVGVDGDAVQVKAVLADFPALPIRLGGGVISKNVYKFVPVTIFNVIRISRTVPGRAFFLQRSRRSGRRRA